MRKYFLLSAVALMTASTANATDGAGNLTASVRIVEPTIVECTPIDFGTLYFKFREESTSSSEFLMDSSGAINNGKVTKYSLLFNGQGTPGTCTGLPEGATFTTDSDDIIYLDEAQTIFVNNTEYTNGKLTGTLNIKSDAVLDGSELTGSAVVEFFYE